MSRTYWIDLFTIETWRESSRIGPGRPVKHMLKGADPVPVDGPATANSSCTRPPAAGAGAGRTALAGERRDAADDAPAVPGPVRLIPCVIPPGTRGCGTVSPDACGDWSGAITAPGLARYRRRQPERR
jgi:hypothetical protein